MVVDIVNVVGLWSIALCNGLGSFVLFFINTITILCTTRLNFSKFLAQIEHIGIGSLGIVILTGTFAGMVFALQTYIGFKRVGGEQLIGTVVAMGMIRELGPVLTGLMVTGRAGSAIAAEIGTMRITEQIDALQTLRINTFQYLIVPRMLAGTIIMPLLTVFAMICGIVGGYVVCVHVLELSPEDYINGIKTYVELHDINSGLTKSAVFGLIMSWVGTYKGYHTHGGAQGVGQATTQSVVAGSMLILIANYFLTKLLEQL